MADIDLGTEDGFVTVVFEGVEVRLDLFDTNDKIRVALENKDDAEGAVNLAALMRSLGFPEPSRRAAVRFANAVIAAVEGCKKKPSGTAPSLASTE